MKQYKFLFLGRKMIKKRYQTNVYSEHVCRVLNNKFKACNRFLSDNKSLERYISITIQMCSLGNTDF